MAWSQFSNGFRLDPIVKGSPQALVALLHDRGASATSLKPVAMRWAMAVPTTAFIALDGIEQLEPDSLRFPNPVLNTELALIESATRSLEPVLADQLRSFRLNADRLVFAGFGYGGTLALHSSLHQGWRCGGVLAFAAKLIRPLPRIVSVAHKVRLIGCAGSEGHNSLRDDVTLLTARGIDTRGVVLGGSALSEEAIRHGGAYLVELVATAQRGDRYHAERTARGSASGKRIQVRDAGRQS
jgi:predicted esterase